MATASSTYQAARGWQRRRADRRALARFGEFWAALQQVGDVLAEAERLSKSAVDNSSWRPNGSRHWTVATADEVRSSVKRCRSSLRVVSAQAKRFEPELIVRDWRR
ncbi:MAG: hypothetical protein ACT4RN_21435 [Pseudonocardia sp.]